jgi:hypothetical protein
MSSTATQSVATRADSAVTSRRIRLVSLIGPLTALSGLVWAIVQPDRLTILHPHGQTFWWLAVEPPLLVMLAGALFHLLVARGLLDDLEDEVA